MGGLRLRGILVVDNGPEVWAARPGKEENLERTLVVDGRL
jgi:hypothetical protein